MFSCHFVALFNKIHLRGEVHMGKNFFSIQLPVDFKIVTYLQWHMLNAKSTDYLWANAWKLR